MGTRTGAGHKRAQRASTDIMIEVKRLKRTSMEEAKEEEKESDQARGQTRINLRLAFRRWRELRKIKGCKTDAKLDLFLLAGSLSYVLCC